MNSAQVGLDGARRFQIKRELGSGGMGVVYEAFDREKGVTVALKTLTHVDAKGVARFKREFRALQDLQHPNIVSLGELLEADGKWFFTMELIQGCDFLSYVWSEGAPRLTTDLLAPLFDEARLRSSLRQLATGLVALHELGLVHRDIKPSNILITPEGRTVLMDFGLIAEVEGSLLSMASTCAGTPEYMAPEQARGDQAGSMADWYSVGVLLYEALTGRLPFIGSSVNILMDKLQYEATPPRAHVPGVAPDLDELCVELLRREPTNRPAVSSIVKRLGLEDLVEVPSLSVGAHTTSGSRSIQPMPFVGRDNELALLGRAFDAVKDKPLLVLIEGESGMGKSSLVEHFLEGVAERDRTTVVLSGRCYEREQVPYKAFDGIADSLCQLLLNATGADAARYLPLYPALLPLLFPVLKRVDAIARAPIVPALPDAQAQRTRMFGAFRELLLRLAQHKRLIIVLDDLQWTCADSLTLFEEVFGHEDAPPALILAMLRPIDQAKRALLRAAARLQRAETISVNSLPTDDTSKLATLLMPGGSFSQIQALVRETGGHPLFMHELARHSQAGERGISLDAALQARMASLPRPAVSLLEVLCLAGRPITQAVAALASKLEGADFAQACAVLRVAHLARTGGTRQRDSIGTFHDRVREAFVATLAESQRVATHEALTAALERTGGDARDIVRHAQAAGQPARAAANALVAAQRADDTMAFDQAAELYETALALGTHDEATTRTLRLKLATALVNSGRGPQAAQTFALVSEDAEPALRRDCQRRAAEQWLITGRIEEGLSMIDRSLTELGEPLLATPKRALAALIWRRLCLFTRGLEWQERPQSEVARSDRARLEVLGATATGLSMVDYIRGAAFAARYLRVALDVGDARQLALAFGVEAFHSAGQGNHKRANALLQHFEELCRDHPEDGYFAAGRQAARGVISYFAGHFRVADAALAAALEQFVELSGTTFERNNLKLFRVFCLRNLGELRQLAALTDWLRRDAQRRGDLFLETSVHRYASRYACLAKDRPDEALIELTRCAWPAPKGVYHVQDWFELEARCEIALYAGQSARIAEETRQNFVDLRRSLLLRATVVRVLSRALQARIILTASQEPARLRHVTRMARQLERESVGFARVYAHLLFAAVAKQRGQDTVCAARLREAIRLSAQNDMAFHLAAARRRLGQLLGGQEGNALLAESDAWMAKEGIVNAERMCEVVAPGF